MDNYMLIYGQNMIKSSVICMYDTRSDHILSIYEHIVVHILQVNPPQAACKLRSFDEVNG